MSKSDKLPISALVVSYNEAGLLDRCLRSIDFCDEIVVYDLGSTDDSAEVAKNTGATVRKHRRVPHAEIVYAKEVPKLKHDWVLVTDPDEEVDSELRSQLFENFRTIPSSTAVVRAPMQYYFKNRALRGTVWGGISNRQLLMNRQRAIFRPLVNTPITIRPGFKLQRWPYKGGVVHHYWMRGYRELLPKHRRYLTKEGKARYERGERVGYIGIIRSPLRSFYDSFVRQKGYLDGLTGFILSLFWAWYNTNALVRLKREQLSRGV